MKRRVAINGMGWITPLGHDLETVWKAMLEGQSGVAATTLFDARTFPTAFSADALAAFAWGLGGAFEDMGGSPSSTSFLGVQVHGAKFHGVHFECAHRAGRLPTENSRGRS